MIAYDLDGVLTPDLKFDIEDLQAVNRFRTNCILPIFRPRGKWGILTARPIPDTNEVYMWVCEHFKENPPSFLIQEFDVDGSMTPADYKASKLNEWVSISTYIESDLADVALIRKRLRPTCNVLHFSSLIHSSISKVS